MQHTRWWNYLLSSSILCLLSAQAWADPPTRVGRVNFSSGSLSYRPASVDEWADATINHPLTTGDELWTNDNSRSELHIGSTAIRLAADTDFHLLNLDDHTVQLGLIEGSINVRLRQLGDQDAFEIDTPNTAISLLRPGDYRIDVDPDGSHTTVTVRGGQTEVTANDTALPVYAQQTAVISGLDEPTSDVERATAPDTWDDWCSARDRHEEQVASLRYVSRETIGYEDLDDYGFWRVYPGYGAVWIPTTGLPSGWAPYRYGHWAWVEPWGWTWVDDAPWGFAPFHYGRWAVVEGTWAWIPGPIVARPVYAPALVAFIGGEHLRLSLSFGAGIAWFPLGPGEAYVPSYRVSPAYVRRINVTNVNVNVRNYNVTNITNVTYVNRAAPGAVTAVSREDFAHARSVAKAAVVVPAKAVADVPIATTAPVAPIRESVLARSTSTPRSGSQPPEANLSRGVVARRTPPPPPTPFAERERALANSGGKPLDVTSIPRPGSGKLPLIRIVSPKSNSSQTTTGAGTVNTRGAGQTSKPVKTSTPPARSVTTDSLRVTKPKPPTNEAVNSGVRKDKGAASTTKTAVKKVKGSVTAKPAKNGKGEPKPKKGSEKPVDADKPQSKKSTDPPN